MSILMKGEQSASKPGFFSESISDKDPEVADAINKEFDRQQYEIELIASENIVSKAVLEAAGSVLTNKYAEGYPGRRYYGGCQFVDIAEQLAIDRAKKLFGCTLAARRIRLSSWLLLNQVIQFWDLASRPAGI